MRTTLVLVAVIAGVTLALAPFSLTGAIMVACTGIGAAIVLRGVRKRRLGKKQISLLVLALGCVSLAGIFLFGPYFAAGVSSVAFAGVIVMDMIMRDGVYSRWSQPLAISCLLNPIFGWPLLLWFEWHTPPIEAIILGVAAGVVLAAANAVYFWLMFSPAGKTTEISCYDGMAPVVIVVITLLLPSSILLAIGSMTLYHLWDEDSVFTSWHYRIGLICFAVLNGVQVFLLGRAEEVATAHFEMIGVADPGRSAFAAANLFYWVGLLAGIPPIFVLSREWKALFKTREEEAKEAGEDIEMTEKEKKEVRWRIILKHLWVILLVEVVATVAFASQAFGLKGGHPAVISMITSTFLIVIFLTGLLIGYYAVQEELRKKFPLPSTGYLLARKILVIGMIFVAVVLAANRLF